MYWGLIVNPTAGSGFAMKAVQIVEPVLQSRGILYRVSQTEYPGHGTELARALSKDPEVYAVVAVGGDGTAREVAAGLCNTDKPMGIIPAGTGNDFIKSVGIPNDIRAALECMLSRQPVRTDTGRINGRFFLNVCGTGFDVTVLDYEEKEKARHRGILPYFLGLLKAIFHYQAISLTITADGTKTEGSFLVCSVANGKYIGGGIPICPVADPADGLLDLVVIRDRKRWQIPFYLPGLMLSKALKFRISTHRKVSAVLIEGSGLRFNIDGEILSMDRADFSISPSSLLLIR